MSKTARTLSISLSLVFVFLAFLLVSQRRVARVESLPAPPKEIAYDQPVMKELLPLDALELRDLNALAQAHYRVGKRTGRQESFEKAKDIVARSLKEQPSENRGARTLAIRLLQAEHEFEESLAKIQEFEKEFPSIESSGPMKITALVALGRTEEAEKLANAILEVLPTSGAYVLAGSVAEEAGKAKRAVELLTKAIRDEEPSDAATLTFPRAILGRLYLRRGQFEEARACLSAALKIDPDDVVSLRLIAHLDALEGKYREAEQSLTRAIGVYSDADILVQLSRVKRLLGQEKQADDMLKTAEEQFRKDIAESHYGHRLQMAQMLLEKKTPEAAREAAQVAREDLASRGHPFVKITLARALNANGAAAEASQVLAPVLASAYEHPHLFLVAGEVAKAEGKGEEATKNFRRAESLNSKFHESCDYCPLF